MLISRSREIPAHRSRAASRLGEWRKNRELPVCQEQPTGAEEINPPGRGRGAGAHLVSSLQPRCPPHPRTGRASSGPIPSGRGGGAPPRCPRPGSLRPGRRRLLRVLGGRPPAGLAGEGMPPRLRRAMSAARCGTGTPSPGAQAGEARCEPWRCTQSGGRGRQAGGPLPQSLPP